MVNRSRAHHHHHSTSRDLDPASIRRTRIYYLVFFAVFGGALLMGGIILVALSSQGDVTKQAGKRFPGIVLCSIGGFLLFIAGIIGINICRAGDAPVGSAVISIGGGGGGGALPVDMGPATGTYTYAAGPTYGQPNQGYVGGGGGGGFFAGGVAPPPQYPQQPMYTMSANNGYQQPAYGQQQPQLVVPQQPPQHQQGNPIIMYVK